MWVIIHLPRADTASPLLLVAVEHHVSVTSPSSPTSINPPWCGPVLAHCRLWEAQRYQLGLYLALLSCSLLWARLHPIGTRL